MTPDYTSRPEPKRASQTTAERAWYILTAGNVYGPFDDKTVWTYVQEGRINGSSELSLRPDGGWMAARDWLEIAHWFTAPRSAANTAIAPTPSSETIAVPKPVSKSLSLVVADIKSGRSAMFNQVLYGVGEVQGLSDSTWLVESEIGPDEMRTVLGPTLSVNDKLLVMDATDAEVATYNFGPEAYAASTADANIRPAWH
ncbi:MAG: hypothetical protein AAF311_11580 [Pseudomonadota bacterium]